MRPLTGEDADLLKLALYLAVAWNPEGSYPPYSRELLDHPQLARYHAGWGRYGDLGLVAEEDGEFVGLVFCRLFPQDDHGYGFVDAITPELGVAVVDGHRGRGIGTAMMNALAGEVAASGISTISLSVERDNPARHLYERLGYREVGPDDGSVRMVLRLDGVESNAKEGA